MLRYSTNAISMKLAENLPSLDRLKPLFSVESAIDLTQFYNKSVCTIGGHAHVASAHALFRNLGLRHLLVCEFLFFFCFSADTCSE